MIFLINFIQAEAFARSLHLFLLLFCFCFFFQVFYFCPKLVVKLNPKFEKKKIIITSIIKNCSFIVRYLISLINSATKCSEYPPSLPFQQHVFPNMRDWFTILSSHLLWIRFLNTKQLPESRNLNSSEPTDYSPLD